MFGCRPTACGDHDAFIVTTSAMLKSKLNLIFGFIIILCNYSRVQGWAVIRVIGPRGPYTIGKELYAHTNPVFFDMKDKPLNSPEDATYFIKWIDRLEADFEKRKQYPNEKSRLRVLRELDDARNVYRNIVSQSANH
jgi:hypothetical protein